MSMISTPGLTSPKSWYRISLVGLYIGDTTKNGNTLGNAARGDGRPRDDKTIGWEINFINVINIYKTLEFNIGFGYLFAGKALSQQGASGENISLENPRIFTTRLIYTF